VIFAGKFEIFRIDLTGNQAFPFAMPILAKGTVVEGRFEGPEGWGMMRRGGSIKYRRYEH
jgi:hypothetical protein